jgi:hypothetical protein
MEALRVVAMVLLAATPLACSTPPTVVASPTAVPPIERPADLADANGCRITVPTTTDHPKDANTAAFSRAWFVSSDRLLWASATGRLYAGENKVLWERPGTTVTLTGRLWGDPSGLVPTITASRGYERESYQASGITFPAPGCWEVVARAASSDLRFVVFVYPATYSTAARRCQDLTDIYAQSDAVVLATSASQIPDTNFPGFTWYTLHVSHAWKGPISVGGAFELLSDADAEPRITPTMRYVLFLARDAGKPWRIICSHRSVMADLADRRLLRPTDHQQGTALITDTDFSMLDARLRALAK